MPLHMPQDVLALTESVLGNRVTRIEKDYLGASNAVYFATLADGLHCVVRISPPDQGALLAQEIWAYTQARVVGVPVPEILAADTSLRSFPKPYIILRRLPGVPAYQANLAPAEWAAILKQLGHYLSRIHTIRLPGFGYLVPQGAAYAGRSASLWDYVQEELDRCVRALPAAVLSKERAEDIRARLQRERSSFVLGAASLLHGDYQLKNVLIQGVEVTGIVDFETLVAGDPVADFRALHYWSKQQHTDLDAVRRGYGDKRLFDDAFMKKLYLYEILLALAILWWEHHFQDAAGIAKVHKRLRDIEDALDAL